MCDDVDWADDDFVPPEEPIGNNVIHQQSDKNASEFENDDAVFQQLVTSTQDGGGEQRDRSPDRHPMFSPINHQTSKVRSKLNQFRNTTSSEESLSETVVPNISKTTPINSSPTKEASKTSSGPTVSTTSSAGSGSERVVVPTATKTGTVCEPVNTPSSSRASSKKSPCSTDRRAYQEPLAKFPRVEENRQTPDPVSSEFEEIRKLVQPTSNSRRKFPGPAGILPRIHQAIDSQPRLASILSKQDGRTVLNAVGGRGSTGKQQPTPTASTPAAGSGTTKKLPRSSSGRDELITCNDAWQRMMDDRRRSCSGHGENEDDPQRLIDKFNIAWIKKQMKVSSEIKHTPMLVAVVQTLNAAGDDDPTCSLLDESGTISGMIHSDVMVEHGSRIQPGTVLVLSNVAILITIRKHYVNITRKNIAAIYWSSVGTTKGKGGPGPGVFSKIVYKLTPEDVMNSFSQINREEAQAVRRAKELERQAVLEASGGQIHQQEYANTGAHNFNQVSRPPRMQVSQPQFRQPVPGPSNQYRANTSAPRPTVIQNIPQRQHPPVITNNSEATSHQGRPNLSPGTALAQSENNDLLDDLDEESLFGDF